MQDNKFISEFVSDFDNKGTLIDFTLAGFGGTLASIVNVPGCSRVLHACRLLYSEQAVSDWTNRVNDDIKSVSVEMLEQLMFITDMNVQYIVGTAALTTNRWRKGENLCLLRFRGPIANLDVCIKFPKLTEEKYNEYKTTTVPPSMALINRLRCEEDRVIAQLTLSLLKSPTVLDNGPITWSSNIIPDCKVTISRLVDLNFSNNQDIKV